MSGPARTVHCTDAFDWLANQGVLAGASLVTSLPDVSELRPMTVAAWRDWFAGAAERVVAAAPDDGVALFYQTDAIIDGEWHDKAWLVARGAARAGARMLFHQVACRDGAMAPQHGRPGFAHLLGFSRGRRLRRDVARIDVLPSAGRMLWSKAIGIQACAALVRFVREQTESRVIVDPFCGHGTVLAVANALGIEAVGVDRVRRRAQVARNLVVDPAELG